MNAYRIGPWCGKVGRVRRVSNPTVKEQCRWVKAATVAECASPGLRGSGSTLCQLRSSGAGAGLLRSQRDLVKIQKNNQPKDPEEKNVKMFEELVTDFNEMCSNKRMRMFGSKLQKRCYSCSIKV